ncbi:MAG: hypothetical protein RLZZ458_918 [Planctomycetota bacterium]
MALLSGLSVLPAAMCLVVGLAAYHPLQDAPASSSTAAPAAANQTPAANPPSAPAPDPATAQAGDATKAAPATTAAAPATASPAPVASPKAGQQDPPGWFQFLPFIMMAFLFYFLLLRPQQREQARRREQLNQLRKNDRVVTTGGIVGTISDLSSDNRFVTLKVDDTTRIRFLRSAIHGPLDEKPESTDKK